MIKFINYLKTILFTVYLLILFLLIDKLYRPDFITITYFIMNFLYALIIILSIISKKKVFRENVYYNIFNIGIYVYNIVIYYLVANNTRMEILNNQTYFRNNFLIVGSILIGLIFYSLFLNGKKEIKKNGN